MERPVIKDKSVLLYVEFLEKELETIKSSPAYDSYVMLKNQIEDMNMQLSIEQVSENDSILTVGRLDLFSSKDDKSFDRGWKVLLEINELVDKLDLLRKKLTPEEVKEADNMKKVGFAEKLAMNGKR